MEKIDLTEVRDLCARIVNERESFIKERGEKALGPIMGIAMKELRGKVDGKVLSEVLSELIRQRL
jgi:glutamyl-tRNA(Gln) amidotransferase subunit E